MRKGASNGAVFGAILVAAVSSGIAGCASIWGFQDAIDEREGAPDATTGALDGAGAAWDTSVDSPTDSMQGTSIAPDGADAADGGPAVAALDAAGESMDAGPPGDANALDGAIDTPPACDAACVPAAPQGWLGPLLLSEIFSLDAGSPGCANDSWVSTLALVAGPSADPASCTCNCGPPSGVNCSTPSVSYFRDRLCTMACAAPTPVGPACTSLVATGCGAAPHFAMGPSTTDGGACAPLATMSLPPVAWSSSASLCAPAPSLELGACQPGQACVPSTDSASTPEILCVAQEQQGNDVACPSGYGFRHSPRGGPGGDAGVAEAGTPYFAKSTDARECSACSCEAPSGATCANSGIVAYADTMCAMPAMTMEADSGCLALGDYNATCAGAAASGGRCEPTGGVPTGGVMLTLPYTICCNR